ncbi:MAG: hypothetical protein ACE5J3_13500, partial [Methanosarcinales archaeon]
PVLVFDKKGLWNGIKDASTKTSVNLTEFINLKLEDASIKKTKRYASMDEMKTYSMEIRVLEEKWSGLQRRIELYSIKKEPGSIELHISMESDKEFEWTLQGTNANENSITIANFEIKLLYGDAKIVKDYIIAKGKKAIFRLKIHAREKFDNVSETIIITDNAKNALTLSSLVKSNKYVPVIEFNPRMKAKYKDIKKESMDSYLQENDPDIILGIIKRLRPKRILTNMDLPEVWLQSFKQLNIILIKSTTKEEFFETYREINREYPKGWLVAKEDQTVYPLALITAKKEGRIAIVGKNAINADVKYFNSNNGYKDFGNPEHLILLEDFKGLAPVVAANYAIYQNAKILPITFEENDDEVVKEGISSIAMDLTQNNLTLIEDYLNSITDTLNEYLSEDILKTEYLTIFTRMLEIETSYGNYKVPIPFSFAKVKGKYLGENKVGYVVEKPDIITLQGLMCEFTRKHPVSYFHLLDPVEFSGRTKGLTTLKIEGNSKVKTKKFSLLKSFYHFLRNSRSKPLKIPINQKQKIEEILIGHEAYPIHLSKDTSG